MVVLDSWKRPERIICRQCLMGCVRLFEVGAATCGACATVWRQLSTLLATWTNLTAPTSMLPSDHADHEAACPLQAVA